MRVQRVIRNCDGRLVAVAVCFALAACGGGEDSNPQQVAVKPAPTAVETAGVAAKQPPAANPVGVPAPAPIPEPVATPTPKPPKIVLIDVYGDDAMMGITSSTYFLTIAQQTEPVVAQTLLRAQFGDGITIVNRASGGTASTLVNMMAGVDGGGPPFAERVKASKADIVLMNHAINDNRDQSLAPYTDAMIAWIKAVRDAGKIPVLEEPNPVCDGNHPYLQNYVATMASIAEDYKVPLVKQYDYIQGLPNWQSHFSGCLYPDAFILAIKGQRQAEVLGLIVAKLLQAE